MDHAIGNKTVGSEASTAVMQALGMIMIGGFRQDGIRTAKARVALGEHVDDTALDSERADLQLLEIARTGIFPRLNERLRC